MQKSNLIIVSAFALILIAHNVSASVLVGPSCFVTAEVVEIDNVNHYLSIKILNVNRINDYCPVQENQIYQAIDNYYAADNYPASFKEGDKIKAGIEAASSMGSSGVVSFLHWSDVTYENDTTIKYKKGIVTYLQSDDEPTIMDNTDNTKQEDIINEKDDGINKTNIYYLYFITPILIIIGFLLYWFLRKRSAL